MNVMKRFDIAIDSSVYNCGTQHTLELVVCAPEQGPAQDSRTARFTPTTRTCLAAVHESVRGPSTFGCDAEFGRYRPAHSDIE
jgi:hypothetical protein